VLIVLATEVLGAGGSRAGEPTTGKAQAGMAP